MSRLSAAMLLLSDVSIARVQNCVLIAPDPTGDAVVAPKTSQRHLPRSGLPRVRAFHEVNQPKSETTPGAENARRTNT
jgi:hypothetical protein